MKPSARHLVLGLTAVLAPLALVAQTTTPPAVDPNEPITLSAFEVASSRDSGYRVQNTVATTGIAQALIETPLPITVITEEFMRDAGLRGFLGAVAYVSSVATDDHTANGNYGPGAGASQGNLNRFRGQPVNGTFRNGLRLSHGFDTENIDRIEVAKGPLAVFVGGATLGGEVNIVTKQPQFRRFGELTFSAGSWDTYSVSADVTGPLDARKTLAYRVLASYRDANTWRDFSDTRTTYVSPQLLWRPNARLSVRLDYAHRFAKGNLVSQNVSDTSNFQADFDRPRPILLNLGVATLGRPFTIAEYRNRIGQAFGTWRQDIFDATGRWVTLGEGLGLIEGNFPGGREANSFGPYADFVERTDLLENESTFAITEWLQAHFIGRAVKSYVAHKYFSFSQRLMPAGNYNLTSGYQGRRLHEDTRDAKLEAVLKHKVWITDFTLLVGGQYGDNKNYNEGAVLDYSGLAPVPGSPNVLGTPAILTGANIANFFDPRVHAFPDNRAITRWPSVVTPAGVQAYTQTKTNARAGYAALSLGFFDRRVILTGGFRRSWLHAINSTMDRDFTPLTGTSSGNPSTDNHTIGAVVRIVPGLNAYASINQGETIRTGSMVGRVSFGVPPPPLDIVTPAEQAANRAPNALGKGREAGLKFDLFNRKLTGSIGWFELTNGNILVTDNDRNAADPRNVRTEVDPNPATADPGRRLQVSWNRAIEGNTTEGIETDLVWTPRPSYSVVFAASHLLENKITVARPVTADPTTQRTYLVLNGRELDNSPNWMLRVFQQYRFMRGALRNASVGLGVRYQSEQSPVNSDTNWGQEFPAYTVVDLQLGYATKVRERPVHFQLGVANLLDREYVNGNRAWASPHGFTFTTRLQF
ncbi:MAG: TonB-dependent receptor plug domain-containing protein [Opitutaceae bacterium]|nr:TonB-dependent receptor plug domain-containing protein [Opitutaceae bacterium]